MTTTPQEHICEGYTTVGGPCSRIAKVEYEGAYYCPFHVPNKAKPVASKTPTIPKHIQNTLDLLAEARRDLGNEVLNGGQLSTMLMLARSSGVYEVHTEHSASMYDASVREAAWQEIKRIKDENPWPYNSSF